MMMWLLWYFPGFLESVDFNDKESPFSESLLTTPISRSVYTNVGCCVLQRDIIPSGINACVYPWRNPFLEIKLTFTCSFHAYDIKVNCEVASALFFILMRGAAARQPDTCDAICLRKLIKQQQLVCAAIVKLLQWSLEMNWRFSLHWLNWTLILVLGLITLIPA